MPLHTEPAERGVDYKYLDKHSECHNKGCEASAVAQDNHHGKCRLQEGEDYEGCPAAIEEECGIAREHKVVGLQLIDNVQSDKHADKESQK